MKVGNRIKQAAEKRLVGVLQFPLVATRGATGLNHEGNMPAATEMSGVNPKLVEKCAAI